MKTYSISGGVRKCIHRKLCMLNAHRKAERHYIVLEKQMGLDQETCGDFKEWTDLRSLQE